MLISRKCEERGAEQDGAQAAAHYQTASELFELMAKNNGIDINGPSLSASDLVILYKNIDVGTRLMANVNNLQQKPANQRVETIVYCDDKDSEGSDVSEIYSNEDLRNVFTVNNERLDLINNISSGQHILCNKCANIEIQSSNLSTDYTRQFLFKDPYIKQQLSNINVFPNLYNSVLPPTLVDYICCKRLEDDYNFYMDNIIIYVQHIIEQLRRISNGDYLTERVKKKWREVENKFKSPKPDTTKALATSVSIPLHVEGKINGHRSTWDDIVHSEVDIRSLSKILEKKIIIEIPKLICGSYRLFSERCDDNLIISCKKDVNHNIAKYKEGEESRVDLVFQLKRSESGHVISNINSIMILQTIPSITAAEPSRVQCKQIEFLKNEDRLENHVKIVEVDDEARDEESAQDEQLADESVSGATTNDSDKQESSSDKRDSSSNSNYYLNSSQSSLVDKGFLNKKMSMKLLRTERDFTLMSPDELRGSIQRLNMQSPVPEEFEEPLLNKKKSPTKVRIKSPYENKSFFMEEKKRNKLLEIREKREKKKMALGENCKISKHKHGKGAIIAQPSSSVTKLSITNKSFYNSIYGESVNNEKFMRKSRKIPNKKDFEKYNCVNDFYNPSLILNQSTFDDGNTETVMQMQQNLCMDKFSTPDFPESNPDSKNLLSRLVSSGTDCESISECESSAMQRLGRIKYQEPEDLNLNDIEVSPYKDNLVPANTPKVDVQFNKFQDEFKKALTPIECRKSIDKIYDLMKKLGKIDESDITESSTHYGKIVGGRRSFTSHVSDSGTSAKHHEISTNPSNFSFGKNVDLNKLSSKDKKVGQALPSVIPKVIISSKLQAFKADTELNKAYRKRNAKSPSAKVPDNPLKAISQLLHDFDHVQKTRNKTHKKTDNDEAKTSPRQGSSKKPRQEHMRQELGGSAPVRTTSTKDKRYRQGQITDASQMPTTCQGTCLDDRHVSRSARRNVFDIIDEAKEARGEAVRGPSRPYSSRLNALAQPKKTYVQAVNEEIQMRNAKNMMAHRILRPTFPPAVDKNIANINARSRRKGPETAASPTVKPAYPSVPPIERNPMRRSASNSPARKRPSPTTIEQSVRQCTVPVTPEKLKKMVAVESYVKSHYGPMDSNQVIEYEVHKSRVPLIPNDFELESMTSSPTAEESGAIGKKLHFMIDTMINTDAPCLSVLAETRESTSKPTTTDGKEKRVTNSLVKIESRKSESDYPVDIFGDKNIVTAVASLPKERLGEDKVDVNISPVSNVAYDVQPFNSATELRKLENALYKKMSVGALPKRLRIKNLTLTPKPSLQQVIVVQSGDAGSLLIKSSLSRSLKSSDSKMESLSALKPLGGPSSTGISRAPTNIPVQVATIGYAFPSFNCTQSRPMSPAVYLHQHIFDSSVNIQKDTHSCKTHKTSQCFKGVHTESCSELPSKCTQDAVTSSTPSSLDKYNSTAEKEQTDIKQKPSRKKESDKVKDLTVKSKVPKDYCKDMPEEGNTCIQSEDIDNSTSLDILMGLLSEIKKITGGAVNNNVDNEKKDKNQCKELEIILNNAANQESSVDNNCRDLTSITSLDKLKQTDSKTSVYSFRFLKNNVQLIDDDFESYVKNSSPREKPKNVDKAVGVEIEKQYANKLTDVPSCFMAVTINHSTNFTDTVFGGINKPSTQSIYSIADYESAFCNSAFDKVVELAEVETNEVLSNVIQLKKPDDLQLDKVTITELWTVNKPNEPEPVSLKKGERKNKKTQGIVELSCKEKCGKKTTNNTCLAVGSDFDSLLKMKRDILVTVYSILVFTVFAALSFPKVFYHSIDM